LFDAAGAEGLARVETVAAQRGVGRMHLQSTLNAVEFYRVNGFVVDEMGSFRLGSGLEVACALMHKDLGPR
jgi:hypothetical protein